MSKERICTVSFCARRSSTPHRFRPRQSEQSEERTEESKFRRKRTPLGIMLRQQLRWTFQKSERKQRDFFRPERPLNSSRLDSESASSLHQLLVWSSRLRSTLLPWQTSSWKFMRSVYFGDTWTVVISPTPRTNLYREANKIS